MTQEQENNFQSESDYNSQIIAHDRPDFEGNIYFTGFMATGKSKLGYTTASMLKRTFIDTDKWIEAKLNLSVADIFTQYGEAYFREWELRCIEELHQQKNLVVALGGGTLTQPDLIQKIHGSGILIRLYSKPEVLSERIGRRNTRPLLANLSDEERLKRICELLAEREPIYRHADFSLESSDDVAVEVLARRVRNMVSAWSYKKLDVHTPGGKYPIFIGNDVMDHFRNIIFGLQLQCDFLIVTDNEIRKHQNTNVRRLQKQAFNCRVFQFPAGESNKNLQTLNRLYSFLLQKGYTRKTCLLQFSGGVIGDMAGFAAATYQRGVHFVQIPTTLLSMVDSSVGGKVGVNHSYGKNMIGAFYQPEAVVINLSVLQTLPVEEYLAGMAEVVKYGVIYDEAFFRYLEDHVEALLQRDPVVLEYVVTRCCAIKAEVVGSDEKEKGVRAILNYGHTFGHALEKLTNYSVMSHGIAVSLGMRVAARLAVLLEILTPDAETRQQNLLNRFGFPQSFEVDANKAWEVMGVDKKAEKGKRVFILPTEIGKVQKVISPDKELVNKAWEIIRG
jgi:shikimate kinase / 3-dehydroquinate synthase